MLIQEDNDIICRVGRGTPGGNLMRQYWLPTCLSSELAAPDCPPIRVRLLGEDLVAFRDTSGQVGLVGSHCPHRGASLFFGRNEEGGLRCVYHGWKFDTKGTCLDMPNAPGSTLKNKLRHTAYPCVEHGRIVWTYMGPMDPPPPFPKLPIADLPDDNIDVFKVYQEQNWLQCLEGGIDPSHAPILHAAITKEAQSAVIATTKTGSMVDHYWQTAGWEYDSAEFGHGAMVAAKRSAGNDQNYWRINIYLLPCYSMAPIDSGADPSASFGAAVPIDDDHVMLYGITWHPLRALTNHERSFMQYVFGGGFEPGDPDRPGSEFLPKYNKRNNYMLDRDAQRTKSFTGLPTIGAQDHGISESQGPIYDRATEHLVPADSGLIAARLAFLKAAKALRDNGTVPPGVMDPEAYQMRAPNKLLPTAEANWQEALRDYYTYRPGYNPAMP